MPRLIYKSLLPALLALSLSCGDDADSASGFAAAYCDLIKPCCAMAKLRTDGQQCQLLFGAFGGQSSYNKQAGEACLAEARAAAASPTSARASKTTSRPPVTTCSAPGQEAARRGLHRGQ